VPASGHSCHGEMLDTLSSLATPEVALYVLIAAYFAVSLTIPFWVPIVKRLLGESGVFWVFSTLTYYAYLAWVLFAVLLVFALHRSPLLGLPWLLAVGWRVASFARRRARELAARACAPRGERAVH